MRTIAVIGCGFGDEGKGKVVSHLCSQYPNSLVIRVSGGHQASHKVMIKGGQEHIFSNFGSGSLQGCSTYWSKFCTVDPVGILNEQDILKTKQITPTIIIDNRCPVTTPYDKRVNLVTESRINHGSCGVGVNQTYRREDDHYSLLAGDLLFPEIMQIKLSEMRAHYYDRVSILEERMREFIESCQELISCPNIHIAGRIEDPPQDTFIIEGSQGLLLDQNHGFFPHVTPANTGIENIFSASIVPDEVYLVTRCFLTRHGAGPLPYEDMAMNINNPYEHNSSSSYQGRFRTAPLNLDLLEYALYKQQYFLERIKHKTLVITCLDTLQEYTYRHRSEVFKTDSRDTFVQKIADKFKINIVCSDNPYETIS